MSPGASGRQVPNSHPRLLHRWCQLCHSASYLRAGLIGLATLGCWSEAVRNLRVFLFCLWMSWSCFHLSLLTGQSTIWHWVFCLQAWLPWANQRLLQAFLFLLLLLFVSSCAIGRLFVFALFLSCNRFLQSVLSGWRFLSRVVVNLPQCCRPLSPHWGFLVWSVASLSRGIWILLAGLGLPSSSYRSHVAARCDAGSSRSGSLVCLVFGFVATLLTIAAWLFWFLHVFVFFLLAAWVFLKASCQRFAYLLFSLCFVVVCLTCLIEFMAALRRTYRNGQRYIYNLNNTYRWVIHGDTSNRIIDSRYLESIVGKSLLEDPGPPCRCHGRQL